MTAGAVQTGAPMAWRNVTTARFPQGAGNVAQPSHDMESMEEKSQ